MPAEADGPSQARGGLQLVIKRTGFKSKTMGCLSLEEKNKELSGQGFVFDHHLDTEMTNDYEISNGD